MKDIKPGMMYKAYVFYCFHCPENMTVFAANQGGATRFTRNTEGWSLKKDGWCCKTCNKALTNKKRLAGSREEI